MKSIIKKLSAIAVMLSMASAVLAVPAVPEELKNKIITVIVPFPPGGETDITQRWMASQVKKVTGLDIIVVNKAGANGAIGATEVARSKPDGTTILGGENSTFVIHPATNFAAAPDTSTLQPLTVFTVTPLFLHVSTASNINSVDDLINKARRDPKFAVAVGTVHTQMATSMFYEGYGIKPYMVPFKGPMDMAMATSQGQVDAFFSTSGSSLAFVQGNKVKPIGVAWNQRLKIYPDAPVLHYKDKPFVFYNFQMISVPVETPKHIQEFLNLAWRAAGQTPESRQRFSDLSHVQFDLTIAQTEQWLKNDLAQAAKLAKNTELK